MLIVLGGVRQGSANDGRAGHGGRRITLSATLPNVAAMTVGRVAGVYLLDRFVLRASAGLAAFELCLS